MIPMLISTAYAQGTGIFDQNALIQFLPLVLIFVVFYFLLIRPQQTNVNVPSGEILCSMVRP